MILALDTSTVHAGVALIERGGARRVLAVRRSRVTTHSEELMTLVEGVLAEAGCAPSHLAAIACGAGPGSFTGLRIGLATAKGLCLALAKPLLLVSSLATLAARAPAGTIAVPCLDAFKGEVYAGFYRGGAPPMRDGDELVAAPERVAERIAALLALGPVHVIGDGPAKWPVLCVPGAVTEDRAPPDPVDVARIAAHRLHRGEEDDLAAAAPRYIRPSEAEILLREKAARDRLA